MLFVMLTMIVSIASAQQINSGSQWQFHSINNVGLLEGETGSAFQLQTINGAQLQILVCRGRTGAGFLQTQNDTFIC